MIVVPTDQLTLRIQAQRSMETSVTTYHATILESHRGNRDTVCILGNEVQVTYQLGETDSKSLTHSMTAIPSQQNEIRSLGHE